MIRCTTHVHVCTPNTQQTDGQTSEHTKNRWQNLMTTNFLQAFLLRICVFEANHNSSSRHKQEQQIQTKPNQTN